MLVNNAGVGIGAPVGDIKTKHLDMQLDVNLRSIVIFYRECLSLLNSPAAEHPNALVVNTSSISGKRGEAWLSVYSATKHGVVGWTEAMNKELGSQGDQVHRAVPRVRGHADDRFRQGACQAEDMIRPQDIAEAVSYLLKVSPACVVPEMMFVRPGDSAVGFGSPRSPPDDVASPRPSHCAPTRLRVGLMETNEARRAHRLLGPGPQHRRPAEHRPGVRAAGL